MRLVRETGRPIAQVARELGVNARTLRNWVNAEHRPHGDGNGASGGAGVEKLARMREDVPALAAASGARESRASMVPLNVVASQAPTVPLDVVESPGRRCRLRSRRAQGRLCRLTSWRAQRRRCRPRCRGEPSAAAAAPMPWRGPPAVRCRGERGVGDGAGCQA